MDEYDKKFAEMQKYIPFLEAMIERLQNVTDKSRELQLVKMQQLHGILSSSKRKLMKIETLQKCEDVLQKLHSKVEKGTNAALNFPVKEVEKQPAGTSNASVSTSDQTAQAKKVKSLKKMDETPASPSPPASPDIASKSIVSGPIMIPTERAHDYNNDKVDSKPASPDQSETVATKEPIIIPTERKNEWPDNRTIHSSKTNNYESHKTSDSRSQRHTQSVPNSGSGSRRLASTESNRLDDDSDIMILDSSKKNKLASPESRRTSQSNPTSLLASPPPELNAPLLSVEDLAELLNENADGNSKKMSAHGEKDNRNRTIREKPFDENKRSENSHSGKNSIGNYTNSDIESERRWEEVDKPIVKLTSRKSASSVGIVNSPDLRNETSKTDPKSQSSTSNHPSILKKPIDNRNLSTSPSTKNPERGYTDNYERYPRHNRESHSDTQNIPMPDMNVIKSAFSRLSKDDIANLVQTNLQIQTENFLHTDERNPLFQRRSISDQHKPRPGPHNHGGSLESDFRRENPEFYDGHQQPLMHHQSINPAVGYPAAGQWAPNMNLHMQGPELSPMQQYQQHSNNIPHQDMWNMASNSVPLDTHPQHHIPNQFGSVPNRGIRPLMNPPTEMNFTKDIPLTSPPLPPQSMIPPLMSSPTFPNTQYRGFIENRPYEQPYDRPAEFQHGQMRQQWDHTPNRNTEPAFDRPNEYPHIPPRQSQWDQLPPNRPHEIPFDRSPEFPQPEYPPRPQQWEHEPNYHDNSRGRGINENCYNRPTNVDSPPWGRNSGPVPEGSNRVNERGRGNERFPNERNRPGESAHANLPRSRPSEWDRPPQNESSNRYRDRDPRCRTESTNQTPNTASASIPRRDRDPRLSKDSSSQPPSISKPKETPVVTPTPKPKDPPIINKRDPRRLSSDSRDSHKPRSSSTSSHNNRNRSIDKLKESSKHNSGKSQKDSVDHKSSSEKPNKDVDTMHSPLESLYGVIDTTAKTGKGYGLQKFKIPKIRRAEPVVVPRPPTPPKPSRHVVEEEDWTADPVLSPPPPRKDSVEKSKSQYEEKKMEVTSTTEETADPSVAVSSTARENDVKSTEAVTTSKEITRVNDSEKSADKNEDGATVETSTLMKNLENGVDPVNESQLKDSVTQELIKSIIRKSLESGEGKKLFEQTKLLRLGLDPKKYEKIQKIINADSDSGSGSDKEETPIKNVKNPKKKRRVIISDSSEEECLAERLDKTHKNKKRKLSKDQAKTRKDKKMETDQIEDEQKKKNNEEVEEEEAEVEHNKDEDVIMTEVEKTQSKKQKKTKKAKSKKEPEVVLELPEEPKEETTKPPSRTAKKRRNSLEMLQEDIREMFICEGVVTATGHRMCRLQKEAENNSSSVANDGKGDAASVYISSSPEPYNNMQSDEDEANPKSRMRSRTRTRKNSEAERSKSRLRNRKGRRRVTKISKGIELLLSSDSEVEQSSALNEDSAINEVSDDEKDDTANKSSSPTPEAGSDDFGRTLRRSERVAMKEPRVLIEKADLSKIDSSKIMFDTSSDESFGIDVSELTAAVDISLHPERPSVNDGNESITGSLKKNSDKTKSRKKNLNDSNDRKLDTPVTFDDDVSMTSDISISSCNVSNANKKVTSSSPHVDANKELIGNMLGNLSEEKFKNKINTNIDKESDGEVDEEKDVSLINDNKKPQSKIKKKRCRWQMGIVPKCKKKKSGNHPVESTAAASTMTSEKDTANSLAEMNEVDNDATIIINDGDAANLNATKEAKLNSEKLNLPTKITGSDSLEAKDDKKVPVSEVKVEKKVTEVYQNMSLNDIMEYAWTGQERYKCLLCQFNGKNIVHHYKVNHPSQEIMISRLTFLDAKRAIDEAKDETFIKLSKKINSGPRRKYSCRFCVFSNEGVKTSAMESFYEHCTTHTGEYRFSCINCKYQAISRSSMKSHYLKVCRKSCESFAKAIIEDSIPSEQYIPGYLCSACNYIQLKEANVKTHVENIHKNLSDVEIVNINMSGYFDVKDSVELNDTFDEAISLKTESDTDLLEKPKGNSNIQDSEKDQNEPEVEILDKNTDKVPESSKLDGSTSETIQEEGDNSLSNNLNAFVCPPNLEDNEVEIQLERQKKMQEILDNIGRKLHKDPSHKRLSIIDTLKDKMTTSVDDTECVQLEAGKDAVTTVSQDKNITEQTDLPISESNQSSNNLDEHTKAVPSDTSMQDTTFTPTCEESGDKIQEETDANIDNVEKKMKDPLASLQNDVQKDGDSEHEASDNEPIADVSRSYESDSSDEMSDAELPTDVNSLLEAAGTISTSTNAPMMTTIQRLAAQLQGVRNFSAVSNDNVDEEKNHADQQEVNDATQKITVHPLVTETNSQIDFTKEPSTSAPPETAIPNSGPKNFIRLRRLSGDKLSIPEPSSSSRSPVSENAVSNANTNSSDLLISEVDQDNPEEEYSFLKIENVVSLAPNATNASGTSPIIQDIRKAVGTSPGKAIGVSVLKKPLGVLKKLRPVTNLEGLLGRLPAITPPSKCITLQKLPILPKTKNLKIVKVVRESPLYKPKDIGQSACAPKLKTVEAYASMLTAAKLRNLYKCMARSCTFTTDSIESFGKHYQQHVDAIDRTTALPPYDYETCAYCTDSFSSWEEMRVHFKLKHSFCAFQCSYCFYRAFTQSYVELHQLTIHSGKPPSVILGVREFLPAEMIDRREFVIPFVCKHECDKVFYVPEAFITHLKTKHGSTLSIFKCHLCPASTLKSEKLVTHYKMHGIYKYQCLYCLFGADAPMELHHHLSLMHFNRPPKILERSLPSQACRDKEVLLQLLIRNLDDTFKCSELKIISDPFTADNSLKSLAKRRKRVAPSQNSGEIILTGNNGHPIQILPRMKVVSHTEAIDFLDGKDKSATSQPSNVFINLADTLRASPGFSENKKIKLVKVGENSMIESTPSLTVKFTEKLAISNDNESNNTNNQSANEPSENFTHHEPELELRYINEQLKSKIENAVDPLSLPDHLNCTDEFISINVLDNPEILKSVEKSSGQTNDDKTNKVDDNDDDSDIEILEHIQHKDDNSKNKSPTKTIPVAEVAKPVATKENSEVVKAELEHTELKENSPIVPNSVENSKDSSGPNTPANNVDAQQLPQKLLTLEDIKDTGFSGYDLFKCGYPGCLCSVSTASNLKLHISTCNHAGDIKDFSCIHCSKRFVKIGHLLEHLKIHGLKRFGCAMCSMRFALPCQAVSHMKFKHKIFNGKLIPADPTNPSADGLFVVHAHKGALQKYRGKKGSKSKSDRKRANVEKISFSPADIDALPRQAIYNREVRCAVCPYTTKVRTNIIRHLQLHAKDKTVPESGPVNPVPCLDKKERMFDKMVNLASSSHQNGRMGGTKEVVKASDVDGLPKYVPEQKRYVCGVADCNYLTVDEAMLRCHSKALHPDEVNFRCPHCPPPSSGQEAPQNIPIDKMGVHLKMHDTRLYKCSHCNHHHYHRHVVERHMLDKHSELRPYVKIIREIENTENIQQSPVPDESEEGPVDRDGNYWKCNLCDYKCVYKFEMVAHAGLIHNEKAQFICSMCPFKTTARISLEQHIGSKHVNDPDCSYTLSYERIKGPKPTSLVDSAAVNEPFDTTPLWRRDMPRIRHIRGILLEEENETSCSSETPTKSGKRKNDGELTLKPAKKIMKLLSLDGSSALDKGKSDTKGERIDNPTGTTSSNQATVISQLHTEGKELASSDNVKTTPQSIEDKYGSYVQPNGSCYVCSLCPNYKSRFRQDMKHHLFKELKYWRWHCKMCGYLTVSSSQITKHANRQHNGVKTQCVAIKANHEIETWVQTFLDKQLAIMRSTPVSISSPFRALLKPTEVKRCPPTITLEDDIEIPVAQVSNKTINNTLEKATIESPAAVPSSTIATTETTKTVDLTAAISSLQAISNTHMGNDSDDNDDDGDALVIDSKDESIEENNKDIEPEEIVSDILNQSNLDEEPTKTYVCKHCNMKFKRWRGFKTHVQVNHLKRLGFLCPYCDRSTNSEAMIRQHIRTKHTGRVEKIIHNPAAGGPELSDAFWEKEYGLVRPKKIKKNKLKRAPSDLMDTSKDSEKSGTTETCTVCGFHALNSNGLKVHMRSHANRHAFNCDHCSFTGNSQVELWQHLEINHPEVDWRAQDVNSAGPSENQSTPQSTKLGEEEDYSEDIEEEPVPESFEPKFIHGCFYCNLRSTSLDSVKKHWTMVHKVLKESSEYQTGVPFRYKEIPVTQISQHKLMKCAYCPKKGGVTTLRVHCRRKHSNLPLKFSEAIDKSQDIWVCKWCNESCEASARTAHHHMFHSHLHMRFKKEYDMQIIQKGYVCPECGFVCVALSRMKTHVKKHYDTFRCKRCDSNFTSIVLATQHSTREHPGLSANIEGIATNIDLIMARVSETDCAGICSNSVEQVKANSSNDIFRNLGVAKKSTTKQIIRTPTSSPSKSVARKSTNPLPRYPPGTVFDIDNISNDDNNAKQIVGYSYYGLPKEPVDLAVLNTTMAVGGAQMMVKCNTLAQILNIDPCIVLTDIKK